MVFQTGSTRAIVASLRPINSGTTAAPEWKTEGMWAPFDLPPHRTMEFDVAGPPPGAVPAFLGQMPGMRKSIMRATITDTMAATHTRPTKWIKAPAL